MIVQYDTRPDATVDQKLRSLIESIQLAFGEIGIEASNANTSTNIDISSVRAALNQALSDINALTSAVNTLENTTVPGIDGRVDTLENTTIPGIDNRVGTLEGKIPAAPAVDGAYVLTVTVTSGEPAYTWETA